MSIADVDRSRLDRGRAKVGDDGVSFEGADIAGHDAIAVAVVGTSLTALVQI